MDALAGAMSPRDAAVSIVLADDPKCKLKYSQLQSRHGMAKRMRFKSSQTLTQR